MSASSSNDSVQAMNSIQTGGVHSHRFRTSQLFHHHPTTPHISSASSLLYWPQPHSHFQRQNNVKRSWQWPKLYLVFLWADPQRSLAGLMGEKGNDSPSSVSQQSPSVCIPWIPSQGLCPLCSHFIALLITRGKKSLLFGECLKAHIHEEV